MVMVRVMVMVMFGVNAESEQHTVIGFQTTLSGATPGVTDLRYSVSWLYPWFPWPRTKGNGPRMSKG